ncbi:nitrogen fixation protein FixH [Rhodoferax sp. TH121]|uniref:FixH family protein n=1 Tax=Rhodoferax sp. TH121 TaxID=2022803 RepID=UPI000B966AB1|nr:FixH family protein [Rhodoferax sp. TH121]OYQ41136.1 nitrogen fixation protein FixH [Rhodoferax sp. TH121]
MDSPSISSQPWWHFGHVWLVLAGPAIVVVAGFITLYLAMSGADPVVDQNYYQKGIEINRTLEGAPESLAPAMQARNHAATGVKTPAAQPKP